VCFSIQFKVKLTNFINEQLEREDERGATTAKLSGIYIAGQNIPTQA
jgi:hypothetical protein